MSRVLLVPSTRKLDRTDLIIYWGTVITFALNVVSRVLTDTAPTWITLILGCYATLCAYWLIQHYRLKTELRRAGVTW